MSMTTIQTTDLPTFADCPPWCDAQYTHADKTDPYGGDMPREHRIVLGIQHIPTWPHRGTATVTVELVRYDQPAYHGQQPTTGVPVIEITTTDRTGTSSTRPTPEQAHALAAALTEAANLQPL